ncbi:MAG: hypothetical protein AB7T59_16725 [Hyphomonadaceae bacterium]
MGQYYFHLWSGDRYQPDEIGLDLANAEEAYIQAFRAAQDGWIEMVRAGVNPRRHRFDVVDEAGQMLFELPFLEVISREGRRRLPLLPHEKAVERNMALLADLSREVARVTHTMHNSRRLLAELEALPDYANGRVNK